MNSILEISAEAERSIGCWPLITKEPSIGNTSEEITRKHGARIDVPTFEYPIKYPEMTGPDETLGIVLGHEELSAFLSGQDVVDLFAGNDWKEIQSTLGVKLKPKICPKSDLVLISMSQMSGLFLELKSRFKDQEHSSEFMDRRRVSFIRRAFKLEYDEQIWEYAGQVGSPIERFQNQITEAMFRAEKGSPVWEELYWRADLFRDLNGLAWKDASPFVSEFAHGEFRGLGEEVRA